MHGLVLLKLPNKVKMEHSYNNAYEIPQMKCISEVNALMGRYAMTVMQLHIFYAI